MNKVLLDAANFIEEHGWCPGTFQDKDGKVCVMWSFVRVTNGDHAATMIAAKQLAVHLELFHADGVVEPGKPTPGLQNQILEHRINQWNDAEGRTKEQVVESLRAAA